MAGDDKGGTIGVAAEPAGWKLPWGWRRAAGLVADGLALMGFGLVLAHFNCPSGVRHGRPPAPRQTPVS